MGHIIFSEKQLSFEDLLAGNWETNDPYMLQSLHFCQDWLKGKNEFKLQTSGSTGIPKSILVKRSQMLSSAKATGQFFDLPIKPKLLVCINTEMIGGRMMLVRGLEWDADIYLSHPGTQPFSETWLQQAFDFIAMVPLQVDACLNNPDQLHWLKKALHLIIGGAAPSTALIKKIEMEGLNAFQTYGMTETVSHIALAKIGNSELVYHTLPSVLIGTNDQGCLWVEAPMTLNERIQTNDQVDLLADHTFRWLGRADFTINSGGIKIQPEQLEKEIEPYINRFFEGALFFIYGEKDDKLGEKVVLILEKAPDSNQEQELLVLLKEKLEKFKNPKKIYTLQNFVKTASGKINRHETYKLCGFK